jgi:metallo-beta-lactamase class B
MPSEQMHYQWREPWDLQTPAIPITDKLLYVGNKDVSCHLLKTSVGAVLIDTGFASTTYLLTEALQEAGVTPSDISLIIHTHGHVDHCGGTRRMKELSGAHVALGAADIDTVEKGTALTCAAYLYGIPHFETFEVDEALEDGVDVDCGDVVIQCHHTPGHTPGTMTFTFELPVGSEKLTVGLMGGPGLWTLMDEHCAEQGYAGNREDFKRSLTYLTDIDVDVWLGAHPSQCDTIEKGERLAVQSAQRSDEPNPFIDPTGWKRFIDNLKSEYEKRFE